MENEEDYVVNGTQLSMVGRDALTIPPSLGITYGPNILRLDLSFNRLRNLEGIQGFTELRTLNLDGNEIDDDVIFPLLNYLETLTMNKNKITDLESLLEKITKCLPSLTYLSLLGNTACPNELSDLEKDEEDYQRYRYFVLYKLPKLKFLDSKQVSSKERQEGQKRGAFLKVIAPGEEAMPEEQKTGKQMKGSNYTPLPQQLTDEGDHHGTFGRSRYVYIGKHSEGNRFIRNNDL
ncbi:leucine-rich melanocyte differentiation-associated protein-like [Dendronephthya gigantea]|uniref:leucine-rich melanocyte differentiation-associated protein-like n=1 Tax=Dendronephthya gigantea TaxID=151771 RepID=UPI00106B90EE|nr:leucine-rich melanocyte differentiation-associated protein-like [Dendronephthya gigantea]